jgi:methyl-accepting chemotaxis protein
MNPIQCATGKVNTLIGEIAAASEEQSQGIDQINSSIQQMDRITQSNAADDFSEFDVAA